MLQPLLQHKTGQMAHRYFSYGAQLIQRIFMWHREQLNEQRWLVWDTLHVMGVTLGT